MECKDHIVCGEFIVLRKKKNYLKGDVTKDDGVYCNGESAKVLATPLKLFFKIINDIKHDNHLVECFLIKDLHLRVVTVLFVVHGILFVQHADEVLLHSEFSSGKGIVVVY